MQPRLVIIDDREDCIRDLYYASKLWAFPAGEVVTICVASNADPEALVNLPDDCHYALDSAKLLNVLNTIQGAKIVLSDFKMQGVLMSDEDYSQTGVAKHLAGITHDGFKSVVLFDTGYINKELLLTLLRRQGVNEARFRFLPITPAMAADAEWHEHAPSWIIMRCLDLFYDSLLARPSVTQLVHLRGNNTITGQQLHDELTSLGLSADQIAFVQNQKLPDLLRWEHEHGIQL